MSHSVRKVSELSKTDIDQLFELFETAFQADRQGFETDLAEKSEILCLHEDDRLQAFSTLTSYSPEPGVRVLFSGDTFVCPKARGGHRLPLLWAQHVFGSMMTNDQERLYWLLLCSGFRTYRILPTFFHRFAPGVQSEPNLLKHRDQWARLIFQDRFSGGVVVPKWATPLRDPHPPIRLQNDPDVMFFQRVNPRHAEGDELVCLVPLEFENLRPAGLRLAQKRSSPTSSLSS